MGDGVFNISAGKAAELAQRVLDNDPGTAVLRVFLWEEVETDANLRDLDFVATLEAGTLTEADFTNYVNVPITDSGEGLTVTVQDGSDRMEIDFDDITFTSAGNGLNNTLTRLTVAWDSPGTDVDATMENICFFDFSVVTDGSDITAQVDATGWFHATTV